MSWRSVQLGQELCEQDNIILDLFNNELVKYVGIDTEFKQHLNEDSSASNLILVLNQPMWCSDIIQSCHAHLTSSIDKFYIGLNRYYLLGNDTTRHIHKTDHYGQDCIKFLTTVVNDLGFCVTKTGTFDNDLGRYFNFVQPLTWIYGNKITN